MKFCFVVPGRFFLVIIGAIFLNGIYTPLKADTAPSRYSAYTGTDPKAVPAAPALGPANSVINDPTFGSRILRVTDPNTSAGESFISTDSGFHRAWNADSMAIKLTGPRGDGYWLEFNPITFTVGDGSSRPVIHPISFGATWEWSTVDPDVIYYLNGNQIGKYNKSTGVKTNLGGPSTGEALAFTAVVIGLDNWVCAAAGSGVQDSFTKIFCIDPTSPSVTKFIDVYNQKINGVSQADPNWPTSSPGQVIGIHDISGGTGASWLEVTFHQQSWGGNGGAVFDLATNTWSLVTNRDPYWSGHVSMGNGRYANASGSADGRDSRGMVVRNPDNLMNSSQYEFVGQPTGASNNWCDADHNSWLNSVTNPDAPILASRYGSCQFAWAGEIIAIAVDGSNTVWRFAHNHNGGNACYYAQAFAQISNDGRWALFSSYWDGTLGADASFGCSTRIDTFIVELMPSSSPVLPPPSTPPPTESSYSIPSGASLTSSGGSLLTVGSAEISGSLSSPTPPALAIISYRPNGVLISEVGIPASAPLSVGRLTVEFTPSINTGFAVANPNDSEATISFFFTDTTGKDSGTNTLKVPSHGQIAKFLDQPPFNASGLTNGTFTFSSNIPVSAVAIRGLVNERSEFLMTPLPIANPDNTTTATVFFPHFADGGGWSTHFDLVNPTNATISGTFTFVNQSGSPGSSSRYSIPAHSSQRFTTQGTDSTTHVGSVRVTPDASTVAPVGVAVFSFKRAGVTVSEAGVPSVKTGSAFRMFVEGTSDGLVRTGIAIMNSSPNATTVKFDLLNLDRSPVGVSGSVDIPALGQRSLFLNEIQGLRSFAMPFKGFVRIASSNSASIAVTGVRGHLNERSDFLIATTPPVDESSTPPTKAVLPQLVDGGGYTTQLILYGSSNVDVHSQSGGSLNLRLK